MEHDLAQSTNRSSRSHCSRNLKGARSCEYASLIFLNSAHLALRLSSAEAKKALNLPTAHATEALLSHDSSLR